MSAGKQGFPSFDPSRSGVAGDDSRSGSGGGADITTGSYYSAATEMALGGFSDISDVIGVSGSLTGNMVPEVSNSTDEDVRRGVDLWVADPLASVVAVAGSTTPLTPDTDALKFFPAASGADHTADVATTGPLSGVWVAAGSGVGKTLTAPVNGALTVDDHAVLLNEHVLVKDQADPLDNGFYKQTTLGTVSVKAVLTRDTTFDQAAETIPGKVIAVTSGTVNAGLHFVLVGDPAVFVVRSPRFPFGRYRIRFDQTGGLGTLDGKRVCKAS